MPTKILIADDDTLNCYVVEEILKHAEFEPITVHDGKAALDILQQKDAPSLAILDWMMPEMNGVEVCRRLRYGDSDRQTYLILLTMRDEEESFIEALDSGADDYVVKPFGPRQLLARINSGLRVVQLQKDLAAERNQLRTIADELSRANKKLEKAALTDVLTGLPNRRHYEEFISYQWNSFRKSDLPTCCFILDIDHFKQVNDNYGHKVGDLVLKLVGNLLSEYLAPDYFACRFGGEEFLVICPETPLDQAVEKAEMLREMVKKDLADSFLEAGNGITVSIGVAESLAEANDFEEAVKEADNYLYNAKTGGRDRVFSRLRRSDITN